MSLDALLLFSLRQDGSREWMVASVASSDLPRQADAKLKSGFASANWPRKSFGDGSQRHEYWRHGELWGAARSFGSESIRSTAPAPL